MSTETGDYNRTERSEDAETAIEADTNFVIGGGAINEKKRFYSGDDAEGRRNGNGNLSTSQRVVDVNGNNSTGETDDHEAGDEVITKRPSNYDPSNVVSHMLHTFAGLDRYPNYLSRWSMDDIDTLEDSLEEKLREVRQQKKSIQERRERIMHLVQRAVMEMGEGGVSDDDGLLSFLNPPKSWDDVRNNILNPRASEAIFKSKFFAGRGGRRKDKSDHRMPATVDDVLSGNVAVELDMGLLEGWIDQEMFDVYSFPIFSEEFCTKLKILIRTVVKLGEGEEYINLNLGRRPIDLDTIGMGWVNDLLLNLVMRPISNHLFKETESMDDLDWRQGYIAGYSVDPQAKTGTPRHQLVSHTDDSEVTLNICVGDQFEGGLLRFYGLRGTKEEGQLVGEFEPVIGTALIHAGRHLHEVTTVESGDRYAYVVWARSWNGVRAQTCPCCWLNRRKGEECICGKRWN